MNQLGKTLVFVFGLLLAVPAVADMPRLELKSKVSITGDVVRLGDIARITGVGQLTHRIMADIELVEVEPEETSLTLSRLTVSLRLQLEGWKPHEFDLVGAERVEVRQRVPQPVSDADVEAAAVQTMQDTLGVSSSDLRIQLSAAWASTAPKSVREQTDLKVVVLPPLQTSTGSVRMNVQLWDGPQMVYSRVGRFDVLRRQQVAVSRTSLPRGHVLQERDFLMEHRFLARPADQLESSQITGRQVRTVMKAGEIIALRDLAAPKPKVNAVVVKARDTVQVVAFSKTLQFEMKNAQALQAGRVGDTIRIQPATGRVLSGKVVSAGRVEVRL